MLTTCVHAEQNITIEFKNIDNRIAIDSIFRNSGKNYAISPEVQGTTGTISLTDVPFDTALRNLLNSSNFPQ